MSQLFADGPGLVELAEGGQALYVLGAVLVLWLLQALPYMARPGAKA